MFGITFLPHALSAVADEAPSVGDLGHIRDQIEQLKTDQSGERRRFDNDEQRIRELERQLQQLETQNRKLSGAAQELVITNSKLKTDTDQRIEELQQRLANGISTTQFDSAFSRYLGTHQFTVAGDAAGASATIVKQARTPSRWVFSQSFSTG